MCSENLYVKLNVRLFQRPVETSSPSCHLAEIYISCLISYRATRSPVNMQVEHLNCILGTQTNDTVMRQMKTQESNESWISKINLNYTLDETQTGLSVLLTNIKEAKRWWHHRIMFGPSLGFSVCGLPADPGRIAWLEETESPEESHRLLWTSASALYTSVPGTPCRDKDVTTISTVYPVIFLSLLYDS